MNAAHEAGGTAARPKRLYRKPFDNPGIRRDGRQAYQRGQGDAARSILRIRPLLLRPQAGLRLRGHAGLQEKNAQRLRRHAQQQAQQGAQPGADAGQQSQSNAGGQQGGGSDGQPEDVEFEEVK